MAFMWERISESYNYVFYELCDHRTKDTWPSPGMLATILLSYLYFCKKAGPEWMKNRKPYDLTNVIFYYNVFQIFISGYLFYKGFLVLLHYNLTCQPVSYEDTPIVRMTHKLVWMYTVLKLIELLDTIFFVLRKKSRQISTLHVYHHFLMPICTYISLKYYPNGHGLSLGLINCFVHFVMYTYYLIAGLGPQYQKLLWWKRHVTLLQLIQFFLIFVHNLIPLFNGCDYPKWINVVVASCALHFVYLFGDFYYVNYIKTPAKTTNGIHKVRIMLRVHCIGIRAYGTEEVLAYGAYGASSFTKCRRGASTAYGFSIGNLGIFKETVMDC